GAGGPGRVGVSAPRLQQAEQLGDRVVVTEQPEVDVVVGDPPRAPLVLDRGDRPRRRVTGAQPDQAGLLARRRRQAAARRRRDARQRQALGLVPEPEDLGLIAGPAGYGRGPAPTDADVTWAAYLAKTPVR